MNRLPGHEDLVTDGLNREEDDPRHFVGWPWLEPKDMVKVNEHLNTQIRNLHSELDKALDFVVFHTLEYAIQLSAATPTQQPRPEYYQDNLPEREEEVPHWSTPNRPYDLLNPHGPPEGARGPPPAWHHERV